MSIHGRSVRRSANVLSRSGKYLVRCRLIMHLQVSAVGSIALASSGYIDGCSVNLIALGDQHYQKILRLYC